MTVTGSDFRQGDSHNWRHSELDSESLLMSENADPDFRQDDGRGGYRNNPVRQRADCDLTFKFLFCF